MKTMPWMKFAFCALALSALAGVRGLRAQPAPRSPEASAAAGELAVSGALGDALAIIRKNSAPQCRVAAPDPGQMQKCLGKCRDKMKACADGCASKPTEGARRACYQQCSEIYTVCVYRCR